MKKTTLIITLSLVSALAVMLTGRAVITKAWSPHPPQSAPQPPHHPETDDDDWDDDDEDCDEPEDMDDDDCDGCDDADREEVRRAEDMANAVEDAIEANDDDWDDDSSRYTETEEIHQNYPLAPGAMVNVHRINGKVTIETLPAGTTAEVHIIRKARNREDFNRRKFIIEATANLLDLHEEKRNRNEDDNGRHNVRYTVVVKAPANINLVAEGINGSVRVGSITGKADISSVNGGVTVESAGTCSTISSVNGSVRVGLQRLGEEGLRISSVNGRVECFFASEVNAEISTGGINGSVEVNLPNVTLIGKQTRSSFNGRIGAGGPQIKIASVNGSVSLRPGQSPM